MVKIALVLSCPVWATMIVDFGLGVIARTVPQPKCVCCGDSHEDPCRSGNHVRSVTLWSVCKTDFPFHTGLMEVFRVLSR